MTRRDWYVGVAVVALALLVHAAFPRYEWQGLADHPGFVIRIDRWRGHAQIGVIDRFNPQWQPMARADLK